MWRADLVHPNSHELVDRFASAGMSDLRLCRWTEDSPRKHALATSQVRAGPKVGINATMRHP